MRFVFVLISLTLAACSTPDAPLGPGQVHDPYEATNRRIHDFNVKVDRALYAPASKGYVTLIPRPLQNGVANFAENLGNPSYAVDYLLQGNIEDSVISGMRFLVNSTFGIGGLFDMATPLGLPQVGTDFGATLAAWGVEEGAYQELPFFGPSNERDTVGLVVALVTNPVSFTLTRPINNTRVIAEIFRRLGDRGNYAGTVDSILYQSADSYSQAQLIYLQNRRFDLARDGIGVPNAGSDPSDPYDDPYSNGDDDAYIDPYEDIYDDPYEDPYDF